MPYIAGYQFTTWHGRLLPADLQVGLVTPSPGVLGYGVAVGSYRSEPTEIMTVVNVADDDAFEGLREALRALPPQTVQVIDQFGEMWPTVLIMRARSIRSYTLFNSVRCETYWRMMTISEAPAGSQL